MPGEQDLLEEFLRELQEDRIEGLIREALAIPPERTVRATKAMADSLSDLVRAVWNGMELAGELGSLVKIELRLQDAIAEGQSEWESRLPLFRVAEYGLGGETKEKRVRFVEGRDHDFWSKAEQLTLHALRRYAAKQSANGRATARRLFAEDAEHGFALVDLTTKRFDVVLMNPPFGRPVERTYGLLNTLYSGYHNDLYAAFLRRSSELVSQGFIGCISSRSFIVARRLQLVREDLIIPRILLLWDLGLDVMDAAAVESAAYVIDLYERLSGDFFDSRQASQKLLHQTTHAWIHDTRRFAKFPYAKLLWQLPHSIEYLFTNPHRYEPTAGTAREGMKTFSNERFLRLPWEVAREPGSKWVPFVKGGENKRYFGVSTMLLNRKHDGRELDCQNLSVNGSTAQVRQASQYWFRAGGTYSRRAPCFAVRALPSGCVFSDRGPAILPNENIDKYFHVGWLNSKLIRSLVQAQSNKQDYLTGNIKTLPWQRFDEDDETSIIHAVQSVYRHWLAQERTDEKSSFSYVRSVRKSRIAFRIRDVCIKRVLKLTI